MNRLLSIAFTTLALASAPLAARADYPEKPIRYVLHVSPGGATDIMARKLASGLQQVLGQPIVIDNRPGGRGASQMAELKAAKPDGYTIGSVTNTHLASFHQTLKQYNPGSLDWIAELVEEPYLVVVPNGSPVKSLKDLAEAIRAAPGKMVIAGFVRGSGSHIAWEMFLKSANLAGNAANWVPFDSVGDGVTAVLGGHGAATVAYVDLVKDHVEAGTLRVIGVMTDARLAEFPNVPTFKEQGFDVATSWEQWRGVVGPRGMPDDVKRKLAAAIETVMATPELKDYLKSSSLEYAFKGPDTFDAFIADQDRITADWLTRLGFKK